MRHANWLQYGCTVELRVRISSIQNTGLEIWQTVRKEEVKNGHWESIKKSTFNITKKSTISNNPLHQHKG